MSHGDAFQVRLADFAILAKTRLIIVDLETGQTALRAVLHSADVQLLQAA
jgi:hypothetical protein